MYTFYEGVPLFFCFFLSEGWCGVCVGATAVASRSVDQAREQFTARWTVVL